MRNILLALASLVAAPVFVGTAVADRLEKPAPIGPQIQAIASPDVLLLTEAERESSSRYALNAQLCQIAERDLYTAQLRLTMYEHNWHRAVAGNHPNDAGMWAMKYQQALADHRDAMGREMLYRSRRDIAREDFAIAKRGLRKAVDKATRNQRG